MSTAYRVVEASTRYDLERNVNFWMERGGQLVGGLSVVEGRQRDNWCQPMLIPEAAWRGEKP